MEKRISKNGVVMRSKNQAVDALLKDEKAIERMVDYGASATCSGKADSEVRTIMKAYVIGMLTAAKG